MTRKQLLSCDLRLESVPPYLPAIDVESVLLDEDTKTLYKNVTRSSVDVREVQKQFNPSDYSLQNLALVGAIDKLSPSVVPSDTLNHIDSVDFESLENSFNATIPNDQTTSEENT